MFVPDKSSWLLVTLGLSTVACTLGFDTEAVPFDERRELIRPPDVGPDADDVDVDVPAAVGLGMRCGADLVSGCDPQGGDWPACAHTQCRRILGDDAVCSLAGTLFGYCTQPCSGQDECQGEADDAFASSMRCDDSGFCVPGSNAPCDSTADCSGGELCVVAEVAPGSVDELGARCQSARPGAEPGEPCNADPRNGRIQLCDNGLCLDDSCSRICPDEPEPGWCQTPLMACLTSSALPTSVVGRPQCAPRFCDGLGQCPPDPLGRDVFCSPGLVEQTVGEPLTGVCRADNADDNQSIALGQICRGPDGEPSSALCASRYCLGVDPDLRCSTMCDTHDDCADNQFCSVVLLSNRSTGWRSFGRVCSYAGGSKRACMSSLECNPGEECAPFSFGDVSEDGQRIVDPVLAGHCIRPQSGGVPTGTSCEELPCSVPGACISYEDGAFLCSNVCDPNRFGEDCPIGFLCTELPYLSDEEVEDGIPRFLGFCIRL